MSRLIHEVVDLTLDANTGGVYRRRHRRRQQNPVMAIVTTLVFAVIVTGILLAIYFILLLPRGLWWIIFPFGAFMIMMYLAPLLTIVNYINYILR